MSAAVGNFSLHQILLVQAHRRSNGNYFLKIFQLLVLFHYNRVVGRDFDYLICPIIQQRKPVDA